MNAQKPIEWAEMPSGCWECTSHAKSQGYAVTRLYGKQIKIHRLVYQEMFGAIPDGHVVRHKCDNPSCIRPEHLETGTTLDNARDRAERNRDARGHTHGMAKLTDDLVRQILSDSTTDANTLARRFGVTKWIIRDIRKNVIWTHIPRDGYEEYRPATFGDGAFTAKLTEETVREIRESKLNTKELAKKLGVNQSTVWRARNGKWWKHIQ